MPSPVRDYESLIQLLYDALLRPGDIALDIGAHLGRHTFALARSVAPTGRVLAFEPLPQCREVLHRMRDELEDEVAAVLSVEPYALADWSGESEYVVARDLLSYSGLKTRVYDQPTRLERITVPVRRLDDLCLDLPALQFIKLDAEGGEYHILRGARACLRKFRPLVAFEFGSKALAEYGVGPEEMVQLWDELGCTLYDIMGRRLTAEAFLASVRLEAIWDYVAVPTEDVVLDKRVRDVLIRPDVGTATAAPIPHQPEAPPPPAARAAPPHDPRTAEAAAINQRAVQLAGQGRRDEAVAALQSALQVCPEFAEAHNNLGVALASSGKHHDAVPYYREAIRLKPVYPEAHNNLGFALAMMGRLDEAIASYQAALRQRPDYAQAYNNLGSAHQAKGRLDDAEGHYRRALRILPNYAEAHNNLGAVLESQGRLSESLASYRAALKRNERQPATHNNIGAVYMALGRLDEAIACYDRAIAMRPDYPQAHFNRSLAIIQSGDFLRGWKEFEWRWDRPGFPLREMAQPWWDGRPIHGRTIVVHTEMGLGDILHFIRYVPMIKALGGRVIVLCPKPMIPILSSCAGIDEFVTNESVAEGKPLPDYDVHAPIGSLPRLFGTTLDTVPAEVPYLHADPVRVERWRARLREIDGFKIGIAWDVGHKHPGAYSRAIPIEHFAALAEVPGVRLISLQKGLAARQVHEVAFPIIDLGDEFDSDGGAFMDSAAVMMSLDLVISTDTSVVHLAGALARPTWVVLSYAADWRWLLGREDTPWYPTLRLFRPLRLNGWDEVFARVARELRQHLGLDHGTKPVLVEVAPGELIDKITVLQIKRQRLTDPVQLRHVHVELTLLEAARDRAMTPSPRLTELTAELRHANERLWDVIDGIYACERANDFGPRFIDLARRVYPWNDRRVFLKRQINELLGSRIQEEKGHQMQQNV